MNYFYERNSDLLNHPINKTFEEVLWMTDDEFRLWVGALRKIIVDIWDNKGIPPRAGLNEDEIVDQFNSLMSFPIWELEQINELNGKKECLRNVNKYGGAANQWFPNMLKTRINYKDSGEGVSIYDLTAEKKFFNTQYKALYRNLKKDGFYQYSVIVDVRQAEHGIWAESPKQWIVEFEKVKRAYGTHDYFISEKTSSEYTGNSESVLKRNHFELSGTDLKQLLNIIPQKCLTNIKEINDDSIYHIRYYKYGQKMFPMAFKSWNVTVVQQAVNFPPLIAKWIYERYTEEFKKEDLINVWDCSSGWGGRILGAMSVKDDRNLHYIGNDPNSDNWIDCEYSKYLDLANFYNTKTHRSKCLFPHTHSCEVYCLGSEVMRFNKKFISYKEKISVAGTSSPYFNREQYNDEDTQSYKKFSSYESWRDGFLYETLKTIYQWLRPGGYCWWNTSDLKVGNLFLPLEQDALNFLDGFGMKHVETWKMCMKPMPGASRKNADGESTFKNFCVVNGKVVKYEPIYVFQKR